MRWYRSATTFPCQACRALSPICQAPRRWPFSISRNSAIVSGPFGSTEAQIIDLNHGVRLACEKVGVTLEAENVIHGDLSRGAGMAALDALAERKLEPTAIFCLSDSAAAGVLGRAHARGLQIPAQLSVVGCGDDPSAASLFPPL